MRDLDQSILTRSIRIEMIGSPKNQLKKQKSLCQLMFKTRAKVKHQPISLQPLQILKADKVGVQLRLKKKLKLKSKKNKKASTQMKES